KQENDEKGDEKKNKNGCHKPPRTLLEWAIACDKDKEEEENGQKRAQPLDPDRPDFTEATTTVGLGRVQLETGYTFLHDTFAGTRTNGHSYPESLLRIGMLAEWFEFRIGQNFGNVRTTVPRDVSVLGIDEVSAQSGAEDLYLGIKLA